jgi:hypothetical protein
MGTIGPTPSLHSSPPPPHSVSFPWLMHHHHHHEVFTFRTVFGMDRDGKHFLLSFFRSSFSSQLRRCRSYQVTHTQSPHIHTVNGHHCGNSRHTVLWLYPFRFIFPCGACSERTRKKNNTKSKTWKQRQKRNDDDATPPTAPHAHTKHVQSNAAPFSAPRPAAVTTNGAGGKTGGYPMKRANQTRQAETAREHHDSATAHKNRRRSERNKNKISTMMF